MSPPPHHSLSTAQLQMWSPWVVMAPLCGTSVTGTPEERIVRGKGAHAPPRAVIHIAEGAWSLVLVVGAPRRVAPPNLHRVLGHRMITVLETDRSGHDS